jgi:hypothetical protein
MTDLPLYRTELEIARAVLGRCSLEEWKGLAIVLEREGLPKVDPEFGKRYWPAVKTWFDFYNRVDKIAAVPPRRKGRENWPPPKAARHPSVSASPRVPPSTER